MDKVRNIVFAIVIVFGFVALTAVYTVPQTHRALLLQLGKLYVDDKGEPVVMQPGLHFKIPFVSTVIMLDQRLQTLEVKDSRIVTTNKKDVLVNSYTKWRINNFTKFYSSTKGDYVKAGDLLHQMVDDGMRAEFGKRTISDVVSGERTDIMDYLQTSLVKGGENFGIKVVDVRIKRIDLPKEVEDSVFDRMRAEREQAATEHRANGEREANIIRAKADKEVKVILAKASKQAETLKGQGERDAASIYANAYQKNPEFYAFYKSLQTYADSFKDKNDLLVMTPESDFFRYFNSAIKPRQ